MTPDLHSIAVKIIKRGCRVVGCFKGVTVAVVFIGDKKMCELNRQYRGKNKTTNVLSFHGDGTDLGDIFISMPEAKREAKKYGWTLRYEIARLALHGFLHLLGYDHEKEGEARKMEAVEVKTLANF